MPPRAVFQEALTETVNSRTSNSGVNSDRRCKRDPSRTGCTVFAKGVSPGGETCMCATPAQLRFHESYNADYVGLQGESGNERNTRR